MPTRILYLSAVALLPWVWFPPFPWLREYAQWSDVLFAGAVLAWLVERIRTRTGPVLGPVHGAVAAYLGWAAVSLLVAAPDRRVGTMKLLGMAELGCWLVVTADLARDPKLLPWLGRVVAVNACLTGLAAVVGVVLFRLGTVTELVGTYGDLVPAAGYARAEAGFRHPNMLGSYCVFAGAIIAHPGAALPPWLRRLASIAVWTSAALAVSRALLGMLVAAGLRSPALRRRPAVLVAGTTAVVALVAALSAVNLAFDPSHPLAARIDPTPPSRSASFRTALATLAAHPVFGTGPGTNVAVYRGRPFDAHCTPLNVAATLGFPGLAAFLGILAAAWRGRPRPTDWALWSGLAGLAIDGLASDVEDFRHVWLLLGLALGVSGCAGERVRG